METEVSANRTPTHLALVNGWVARGHKLFFDWLFKEWIRRGPRPAGKATQVLERLMRSDYLEG